MPTHTQRSHATTSIIYEMFPVLSIVVFINTRHSPLSEICFYHTCTHFECDEFKKRSPLPLTIPPPFQSMQTPNKRRTSYKSDPSRFSLQGKKCRRIEQTIPLVHCNVLCPAQCVNVIVPECRCCYSNSRKRFTLK